MPYGSSDDFADLQERLTEKNKRIEALEKENTRLNNIIDRMERELQRLEKN